VRLFLIFINEKIKTFLSARRWWRMPLIQHLGGRDRQISEFEASLVYKVSPRTARAIQRNPVSKKKKKTKTKKNKTNKKNALTCVAFYMRSGTQNLGSHVLAANILSIGLSP
jgi:hypothetical protein